MRRKKEEDEKEKEKGEKKRRIEKKIGNGKRLWKRQSKRRRGKST
jgi:hypothetical protein